MLTLYVHTSVKANVTEVFYSKFDIADFNNIIYICI